MRHIKMLLSLWPDNSAHSTAVLAYFAIIYNHHADYILAVLLAAWPLSRSLRFSAWSRYALCRYMSPLLPALRLWLLFIAVVTA